MLQTFPEIPNDSVCLSSLTKLSLQGSSIVNLPESVAHLSSLRSLDLSDCKLLECVPNNIGRLSSLTELSLKGSSIVNLPESLAHLSSLKSLNLSECKFLECIPKLPPNLNRLVVDVDDDDDDDDSIEEPSGDAVCSVDPSSSDNYTHNKRRKK
jgi:hypothetical protein